MPACRDCSGTGQREIKKEMTTRCPDCDGTKQLPDGTDCKRCNPWGEIGTGEFHVEKKLCRTCMGSGRVSEGSITLWFLIRAIPTTLLFLGGGGLAIWAAWASLASPLLTAILLMVVFGLWGGLMAFFTKQMPRLGEISVINWFLIRAIPTTLVALGAGGGLIWLVWILAASVPVTAILILTVVAIWGALMYFFISHLPN